MPDGSVHNVLFVATEKDYLYAFDADGNNPSQGYLWQTSLLGAGETWVTNVDVSSSDIYPDIGVTGTPVIDPASGTLYVVAKTKSISSTPKFFQRLHAVSVVDGSEKLNGPQLIQATVPGTGDGGTSVSFNPLLSNQRAGLLLTPTPNGSSPKSVFITWASHGDKGQYHGWVIGYNAADLSQQTGAWCVTPNGLRGGIWMAGGALSSDDKGNIFAAPGNGTFDANSGGSDYGESAVALALNGSTLAPTSYFAAAQESTLSRADLDMGISSVVLLPDQSTAIPQLAVTADKQGNIYLLNRSNLGGFSASNNAALQSFPVGNGDAMRSSVAFFNKNLYVAGEGGPLGAWPLNPMTGFFSTTPSTTTAIKFGCSDCGGSGTTPSFSSNGTTNAILWTLDNTGREKTAAILHAYDPANLKSEFYNSGQAANGRDAAAVAVKFTTPVVAHGRVYVGGIDAVTVYGELSPSMAITASPSTIAPGATATLAVTHAGTGQVTISGSDHTSYTIPATGGTQIVTPANTTTYTATATGNDGFQVSATTDVTVVPITLSASSATITAGASSTLSVVAASTTKVVITGTDGTSYTLPPTGGTQVVSPSATTTYTAASTMSSGPVSASAVVTVTPAQAGCLPSSAGARICQPTAGASATAPVTITAGAIAASGYMTAVRAYVDNIAVFTVNNPRATNSQQVSQAVSLGAGTHYLVIIGYLSKGGNVQTSEHFMVGAPTGCYPSTEGPKFARRARMRT